LSENNKELLVLSFRNRCTLNLNKNNLTLDVGQTYFGFRELDINLLNTIKEKIRGRLEMMSSNEEGRDIIQNMTIDDKYK
jgi:hypothetical protein